MLFLISSIADFFHAADAEGKPKVSLGDATSGPQKKRKLLLNRKESSVPDKENAGLADPVVEDELEDF